MCWTIVAYLRMSVFRTVSMPPLANVPAQCAAKAVDEYIRRRVA